MITLILFSSCSKPSGRAESHVFGLSIIFTSPSAIVGLEGPEPCHTQGVTVIGDRLFTSCIDRRAMKAWVYQYALPDEFPEGVSELKRTGRVEVTRGGRTHPSGLDHDAECLWVAVADYRQYAARSIVICLDPETLQEKSSFEVTDHIGTVAVIGDKLALMNWDARVIYLFTRDGRELGRANNPGGVAYQDCQGRAGHQALCSGPFEVEGQTGARLDLISLESENPVEFKIQESIVVINPDAPLGREGFCMDPEIGAIFLPGDYPEAGLYIYPFSLIMDPLSLIVLYRSNVI